MPEQTPRAEIADAIYRFYHLVDDGNADQTLQLFAADAAWTFGPGAPHPGTLRGEQIKAAMEARAKATTLFTRHVVTNLLLTPTARDAVQARYLMTVFRSEDGSRRPVPQVVADVFERWIAVEGQWKLSSRETMPSLYGA